MFQYFHFKSSCWPTCTCTILEQLLNILEINLHVSELSLRFQFAGCEISRLGIEQLGSSFGCVCPFVFYERIWGSCSHWPSTEPLIVTALCSILTSLIFVEYKGSTPQNNVRIKHTCRAAACFMELFLCDSFFFITGRFTFYRYCFGNWSWDREFNSEIIRASKTGKIVNTHYFDFSDLNIVATYM